MDKHEQSTNIRKHITIYTDGACSGNPGPGGWGAVLIYGEHSRELSGHMAGTTNNRMEMFAAISALGALKEPCDVDLYTDSAYLANAFNENWVEGWVKHGWVKPDKGPVLNRDLWLILLVQVKKHNVRFIHVKGHSDCQYNNRCDELARNAITEYMRINKPEQDTDPDVNDRTGIPVSESAKNTTTNIGEAE